MTFLIDGLPVDRIAAVDAAALWSELRDSTAHRFDEFARADTARRRLAQQRLLLALELRWKLEEQVLLPALLDTGQGPFGQREQVADVGRETAHLRALADLLRDGDLPAGAAVTLVGALEGLAGLRSAGIGQALAEASAADRLDGLQLARDMRQMLDRWRAEIEDTGDIEDEEADPVGRPPR